MKEGGLRLSLSCESHVCVVCVRVCITGGFPLLSLVELIAPSQMNHAEKITLTY